MCMTYRFWMSKPLQTTLSVVSSCLQSDLWQHTFDSRFMENANYQLFFKSEDEVLKFEGKIQDLLSSMWLKNTGARLRFIMDTSAPDSWLSVVLTHAKTELLETTYIRKYNDYNDRWELDQQERIDLQEMIDEIIKNLATMYVMLVVNKAEGEDGLQGKHHVWLQEGRMSSLLAKLKSEESSCVV
jgi:hypothetical protein